MTARARSFAGRGLYAGRRGGGLESRLPRLGRADQGAAGRDQVRDVKEVRTITLS